jgi:RNA polymerase sigma factor (sigma-70 family)
MTPLLSTPLLRAQSDRRLVALATDGHDRAFEEIVARYRGSLQRYLRRLLSEPLAEDVLQATFVSAWQALRSGTTVRDLRPWLYRIAHNQALNALRAAGSALPATPGVLAASPEIEVERREELRATLDGIGALPDRQRAALFAVAVADRSHADVAAELGLSDGALRQLLLRARTALRAAASAITPYPVVTWLASGQEVGAPRVAEVAAGAGGAGVAIKAGAVVLAAGAVVAGAPALRDEQRAPAARHPPKVAHHEHAAPSPEPARAIVTTTAASSVAPKVASRGGAQTGAEHRAHRSHRGHSGSGSDDDGDRVQEPTSSSGPGPGTSASDSDDSGERPHEELDDGGSHKGEGSSGSGSSGSGSSGSGSSGESSHDDATLVPETTAPTTVPAAPADNSGEGSGSSGEGSGGGSGTSGSGGDGHSGRD